MELLSSCFCSYSLKHIYISFYIKLLQFNPAERLGAGVAGVEDIKSHPFFAFIEWADLVRWEMRAPSEQTQVKWTGFSGTEVPWLASFGCPSSLDMRTEGCQTKSCQKRTLFNRNHCLYRVLAYFYGNWLLRVCKSFHQRVICDETAG